ncbi:formylglycine-generating enzyme family protein [Taibaiella koreensis]|uniref:formylglycine-generating enzyme family protein n=1 Tax=Taibaiella koreensis TaxID=1268548 RepID=UPI001F08DFCE|nr:SUMF1/EgtB/PvdO family nonheme iron enzyme [Taibaiella koreensis]
MRLIIFAWLLLTAWYAPAQTDTTWIAVPPGNYTIGGKGHLLNPLRQVTTKGFAIAATELTNAAFARFVAATGYITDAERKKDALVFAPGLAEFRWLADSTACWRYPNGKSRGGIEQKMDHPVTTISYSDAVAYCRWAGLRLPTLEEWEIACRAGTLTTYFWGNAQRAIDQYANIWHGRDHLQPDSSDGYQYTAPVARFKPNPWGIYDLYGNVFEFCTGALPTDKPGSKVVHARGGSWWCSRNACNFFNSVDIGTVHLHASFSNQGFRTVKDAASLR